MIKKLKFTKNMLKANLHDVNILDWHLSNVISLEDLFSGGTLKPLMQAVELGHHGGIDAILKILKTESK